MNMATATLKRIPAWARAEKYGLIFLSLLFIYYLIGRILFGIAGGYHGIEAEQSILMRYHAFFYGAALIGIFYVMALTRFLKSRKFVIYNGFEFSVILYFGIWNCVATIVGLMENNDPYYIIGDFFKSSIMVIGYFIIRNILRMNSIERCVRLFWLIFATLMVYVFYGLVLNVFQILAEDTFVRQVYHSILCFSTSMIMFLFNRKLFGSLFWLCLFWIISIQHFLTLSRSTIMLSILSIFLILTFLRDKRIFLRASAMIILLCFLAGGFAFVPNIKEVIPTRRISSLFVNKGQDTTVLGRSYEVRSALINLQESFPNIVIGFGYGAKVKLLEKDIPSIPRFNYYHEDRGGLMHNIHVGYVSVLFRTGIIGLLLFISFQVSALLQALRTVKYARQINERLFLIALSITVTLLITYLKFFITYVLIGDLVIVALLAIITNMHRELRKGSTIAAVDTTPNKPRSVF